MTATTEARLATRASSAYRVRTALPLTAFVVDSLLIGAAIAAAAMLRETGVLFDSASTVSDLRLVGFLMTLGWVSLIALRGGYEPDVFGAGVDEYKRVVSASAMAAGLVGIGCYLAKYQLSRGFFVFALLVGVPTLLLGRFLLRKALKRARQKGMLRRHVIIVGSLAAADEIARVLRRENWLGYEVMGALTPASDTSVETRSGIPVLGDSDDATTTAPALGADLVFFAGGGISSSTQMRRTMWELESHDIHVVVAPSMTDIASERVKIRPVAGLPLIHVSKPRTTQAQSLAKRLFDLTGASVLLLLSLPLMVLAFVSIKLHDGGPALFRHRRIGRDEDPFHCLKFRTMVPDADQQIAELRDRAGQSALLFKAKDDPRITVPGAWLRRYSIDELPQLINVLKGDMSLVGPRPQIADEVALYDSFMARRLRVRPGLTGLWQVSGRNDLDLEDAARLDVYYVDNWSMLQDLVILLRTVRVVLRGDGAY